MEKKGQEKEGTGKNLWYSRDKKLKVGEVVAGKWRVVREYEGRDGYYHVVPVEEYGSILSVDGTEEGVRILGNEVNTITNPLCHQVNLSEAAVMNMEDKKKGVKEEGMSYEEWIGGALGTALNIAKKGKPNDRSEKDRHWAILITELEKVDAYFCRYIWEK